MSDALIIVSEVFNVADLFLYCHMYSCFKSKYRLACIHGTVSFWDTRDDGPCSRATLSKQTGSFKGLSVFRLNMLKVSFRITLRARL